MPATYDRGQADASSQQDPHDECGSLSDASATRWLNTVEAAAKQAADVEMPGRAWCGERAEIGGEDGKDD